MFVQRLFLRVFCFLPLFFCSRQALAVDLQIHGFSDLIGSRSNTNYPVDTINNNGGHLTVDSESRLGLNFNADLGNRLTFASQILAQGNGGAYNLAADWLFATYRPFDEFAVRIGRQINPQFLYSEQYAVGYTYLWTRLPSEVYGLNPIDSFNGVSIIYTHPWGDLEFQMQIYGGAGDTNGQGGALSYTATLDDNKGVELVLLSLSDKFKIRAGYNSSNPVVTEAVQVPIMQTPVGAINGTMFIPADIGTIQTFTAGTSFEWMRFEGRSEIARIVGTSAFIRTVTGAYGTLGYRLLPFMTPYFNYAWEGGVSGSAYTFPVPSISTTQLTDKHGTTVGLNFKVSPSAVVKAEYMRTQSNFVDTSKDFGVNTYTFTFDLIF